MFAGPDSLSLGANTYGKNPSGYSSSRFSHGRTRLGQYSKWKALECHWSGLIMYIKLWCNDCRCYSSSGPSLTPVHPWSKARHSALFNSTGATQQPNSNHGPPAPPHGPTPQDCATHLLSHPHSSQWFPLCCGLEVCHCFFLAFASFNIAHAIAVTFISSSRFGGSWSVVHPSPRPARWVSRALGYGELAIWHSPFAFATKGESRCHCEWLVTYI